MADQPQEPKTPDPTNESPQPGDGPITFDTFRATRRPRPATWPYVVSLVFMLATLVLLVLFKDGCGNQISDMIFKG